MGFLQCMFNLSQIEIFAPEKFSVLYGCHNIEKYINYAVFLYFVVLTWWKYDAKYR